MTLNEFFKKGKTFGLQSFDFFDNEIFFDDGHYISFKITLKSYSNTIISAKATDEGNRKTLNLKKKYSWKTIEDIDFSILKNLKEL